MSNQDKNATVIERINNEIEKINKKESNIFFVVIDTKGNPNGKLKYIYTLALILKNNGYKVSMLYQEDGDFVGVGEWLGDEYMSIPHYDISKGDISVSASDILFIPELFSNVMIQTKKLPCKRIAILQSFDFMVEQMPMASQWGDLGILEAITNTDLNGDKLKDVFPYVKTTTISPYIDEVFKPSNEPQQLVVNIVSKDQRNINKIIKPFYWKYPQYKWVSFRDVRGFPQNTYADMLKSGAITIWVDDDNTFGYTPLEAMKSGSLVVAKLPTETQKWMVDDKGNLIDCCVWFDSYNDIHKLLAMVIKSWVNNQIPSELSENAKKVVSEFNIVNTEHQITTYVDNILKNRQSEMESLITQIKTSNE